jgi:D-glycero-alpha-D-manno-heptose-7-phosphate kinase
MIITRAPYRISLGGGGTDLPSYYSNFGGFVLSAAINKYLFLYVNRPFADELIRLKYSQYEQVTSRDEIQHDLVRPALKLLDVGGSLEIASMADVPAGTGLGSSGTYLVALLTALYELKRERVPTQDIAEQACHIEMELAGHPAGKHDPYLSAFGGITCLDIAPDGKVVVTPLNISISTVEDFRHNVLLFYTGATRASAAILEEQRYDTQRGDCTVIDSLHRTKELGYRVKEALENGDLEGFGLLLDEHWQNKKKRSTKISDAHIDHSYELLKEHGGLGGKVMGAGGGGFFMCYCPSKRKAGLRQAFAKTGLRELPYEFDFEGAKVMVNF